MTTKHTPAPWNIVGKIDAGGFDIKKDDKRIAQYRCFYADGDIDEIKANAKIIAAAPELLEALQNLLDANSKGTMWAVAEATSKANDAIAKAIT